MNENNNITEGSIFKALIKLAIPIMGTSFVQMAYNMTDMIWIGRVGSKSVAAVGTAGFFTWLAMAFILIPKIGAEIGVAQSVGKKDLDAAKDYARHTIQLNIFLALIYGACLLIFRKELIGFFHLGDQEVINQAISYLVIVTFGITFYFINPVLTSIYNGYGDSKTPFMMNTIGLFTNMILDPILIFGIGPFPSLGVKGAAFATISAQLIVTIVFIYHMKNKFPLFSDFRLWILPKGIYIKRIVKLGIPVAFNSGLFTIFAMFIARIVASWGPVPIAVQKVGSQIEAISWMSASGFSTAISTFVGQNYGAKKGKRIFKGYFTAIGIVSIIGIIATCLLIFGARPIFSIFIPEEEAIKYGVEYLKILGLSQLFMCIEITTAGAFNGMGKTIPPAIISILFTGLRVPAAKILSSENLLGLEGIWWSISMSSIIKGILLATGFMILMYKHPDIRGKKKIKIDFIK
ncbi:MATE family efflux transporter [Crassaminicella profunda]|uniref:MATE family efflux transporter n=1 Tax=Crassaminicella profunda TaxID=1286698 RepID=UPI001CA6D55B|nr:MATE family efflux transporter [Crassaminicella profunda]QZY55067.1 MATE family efflux transporter [Crassaminicella profunda]